MKEACHSVCGSDTVPMHFMGNRVDRHESSLRTRAISLEVRKFRLGDLYYRYALDSWRLKPADAR